MNAILTWFEQPAAQRLGWTLLHFVWQGAAIGVLAAAVLFALRNRSANARYVTAMAALAAMAVCPVVTFPLVRAAQAPEPGAIASGAETELDASISTLVPPSPPEPDPGSRALLPVAEDWPAGSLTGDWDLAGPAPEFGPAAPAVTDPAAILVEDPTLDGAGAAADDRNVRARLLPLIPYVVAVWLCGVAVLSLRLLACWCCVERLRRRGIGEVPSEWADMFRRVCERMRVRGP
ncbi:MAG TPA: hypothetical protein VML55_25820, partial [Planctomycetaceae bacterium]|nr:hypothetical protein [Planctomycetaceae bacterium]